MGEPRVSDEWLEGFNRITDQLDARQISTKELMGLDLADAREALKAAQAEIARLAVDRDDWKEECETMAQTAIGNASLVVKAEAERDAALAREAALRDALEKAADMCARRR